MKAVILAGGLGSRLKPFTQVIPKPLLPIGEKSVLEVQIELLKKFGFNEIFLATNYKSEYIKNFFGDGSRYGVKLTISKEEKPLGTAGPLTLLSEELTEPFLVMNGDVLTGLDFRKFYNFAIQKGAKLTMGIKEVVQPFEFGNIFFEGDLVFDIEEKPDIVSNIMAGIYLLKPEIFEIIPKNEYFGMNTLVETMLAKNWSVAKYDIKEHWLDIGRAEDYSTAQDIYRTYFAENQIKERIAVNGQYLNY